MKNKMYAAVLFLMTVAFSSCKKESQANKNAEGTLVPKTVDHDPSLPSIMVNGTQLHSEAFGNPADPMVLFLHGGPGADYRNASNIQDLVRDKYYVVYYDQRGSGLSKRHPKDSYTVDLMIEDLDAVIRYYRSSPQQKVFLFGHSWGAMLATGYANKYPDRVNGLILAEPGGLVWSEVKDYIGRSLKIDLLGETSNDLTYHDQFISGSEDDQALLDYKMSLSAFGADDITGNPGPSPFWRFGSIVSSKLIDIGEKDGLDFTTNLAHFTPKVLFLYSEKNQAYGEAHAQKLSSHFPNVQLSKVDGTGHEMIYFGWTNVRALTLPYLNSLR